VGRALRWISLNMGVIGAFTRRVETSESREFLSDLFLLCCDSFQIPCNVTFQVRYEWRLRRENLAQIHTLSNDQDEERGSSASSGCQVC
jgi:hypothetical protein